MAQAYDTGTDLRCARRDRHTSLQLQAEACAGYSRQRELGNVAYSRQRTKHHSFPHSGEIYQHGLCCKQHTWRYQMISDFFLPLVSAFLVCLTSSPEKCEQGCLEEFRRSHPHRSLVSLRGSLVKLDRWHVSTVVQCAANRPRAVGNGTITFPLCIQVAKLTAIGADDCNVFGDPKDINRDPQVRRCVLWLVLTTTTTCAMRIH